MAISFNEIGSFQGAEGGPNVLNNPTSLQFGPDGRLYVSEQNGSVNAFTVEIQDGEYVATAHEELLLPGGGGVVKSIQNHNDDGSLSGEGNRQVTGLVVTGTADNPVLYISSSDPRIAQNGEKNLDTNSGVITQVTWNGSEWVTVDIIRGLPRSEENHAVNGMVLSDDGTKLYVMVGGNTNNGAPSAFFSYAGEYALSGTMLEVDLTDIASRQVLTDPAGGQGGQPRQYVYDLPTLDDPNDVNGGSREDANGNDVAGPWGGNDGLNMAFLPADAPLSIYADGFRNPYDVAMRADGSLFTVDNGSNGGLGDNPVDANGVETDQPGAGEATNTPNDGGSGDGEPLFKIEEGGYYGHPAPVRANQDLEWTAYDDDGNPDAALDTNTVPNLADRVPTGANIQDGFIIDPSKFTGDPDRLLESGIRVPHDVNDPASQVLAEIGSSSNGLAVYDSNGTVFGGALDNALIVTQFNGNVTLLNVNDAGDGLDPVIDPGNDGVLGTADDTVIDADGIYTIGTGFSLALDVTVGPDGTIWVAELGGNAVTVLAPSDLVLPDDPDFDNDGLFNTVDPFIRDATNGGSVLVFPGQTLLWDFDPDQDGNLPGPSGYGAGLTGVMVDGTTDFEQFFQEPSTLPEQIIKLDNVKFATAAGGGTIVVENVSNGDPFQGSNSGEYLFHTGITLAPTVETFTIKWSVFNPAAEFTGTFQQIGGYIGTGDQSNYLKIVAIQHPNGEIQVALEDGDTVASDQFIQADDLFGVPANQKIFLELEIDPAAATAVPTVTYETGGGNTTTVTGTAIDLSGTAVLDAIKGDYTVNGQTTGLAVGLFSSNTGEPTANTFQAVFDEIEITAEGDASANVLYRVNAGGAEVAAIDGGIAWAADTGASPNAALAAGGDNTAGFAVTAGATVAPTTPGSIFATERWDPTGGAEMQWAFDVPTAGLYEVRLFMGNGFGGTSAAGARVFDVEIEGTQFANLDDLDLSATFGHQVGGMVSNVVQVTDGTLNIDFLREVENPLINGIEIIQLGAGSDDPVVSIVSGNQTVGEDGGEVQISLATDVTVPSDETVTVTFEIVPGSATAGVDYEYVGGAFNAGTGVYTDTVSIAGSSSDVTFAIAILQDTLVEGDEAFTINITGVSPNAQIGTSTATITIDDDDSPVVNPGDVVYRINAGGAEVAANDGGPAWAEDQSAVTANGSAQLGTPSVNLVDRGVAGDDVTYGDNTPTGPGANNTGAPDALFVTERFSAVANPDNLGYAFAVENGEYTVNLYFDELFFSAAGSRVFDVEIEGVLVLDDFDTFATYGNDTGVESFQTTVGDGELNIEFLKGAVNNPHVAAIEIIAAGDTTPPDQALGVAAPAGDFSDDRLDATDVGSLVLGDNTIIATQQGDDLGRDRDYVTFTVPEGFVLEAIELVSYTNQNPADAQAFFAIQEGTQITVDPVTGAPDGSEGLLGAVIYNSGFVGQDLLEEMATNGGPQVGFPLDAFDTPLEAGDYTIWFNQGAGPSTAELNLVLAAVDSSVGAAVVNVTVDSDDVQISNFDANSFQITNTGDKAIAKVEIDVTNALYPDSVFDPFGIAGDTVTKELTINTNGGTGVVAPSAASYIGAGGTAGFKGIELLFDEGVNSGFNPGETLGFSVDMDPNSIAGAEKGPLDAGSSPAWDVGGISGAELIGSLVTITFTDGTTATGQLQSAGNQGGSQTLASQASPELAVTLTVNDLGAGGVGTYDAEGPTVIVNGPAGETVRVVLTKGFIQPTTNAFFDGDAADQAYAPQLQAQLDALAEADFPANNAVEFQIVDVVLTGGDQDISDQFDFSGVDGFDFAGEGTPPLGFTASVIDPDNDDLPIGPVTAPVYLTFDQPVPDGAYLPNANGDFVFEVEDAGAFDQGGWEYKTELSDGHEPFTGTGFYVATENNFGSPGDSILSYFFTPDTAGVYYVNIRGSRIDGATNSTEENDTFARVLENGAAVQARNGVKGGEVETPDYTGGAANGWLKVFQSGSGGEQGSQQWIWANKNVDNVGIPVAYELEAGVTYELQLSQRSAGHEIDRVHIAFIENPPNVDPNAGPLQQTNDINPNENAPLSPRAETNDAPVLDPIADVAVDESQAVNIAITATDDDAEDTITLTIEVVEDGGAVVDPSTYSFTDNGDGTASFAWTTPNVGEDTTYTATVAASDGVNDPVTEVFAIDVADVTQLALGDVLYRVNAGGAAVAAADASQPDWEADTNANPSDNRVAGGSAFSTSQAIGLGGLPTPNPAPEALFQTERFGTQSWAFDVDGLVRVNLYFAEIFLGAPGGGAGGGAGDRLFDVEIEGVLVLDDYDLFADVGTLTATVQSFDANVTDGELNIEFTTVEDNAKISGIEIIELVEVDGLAPTATISEIADTNQTGAFDVAVAYADDDAIDLATIGADDLIVTGPDGAVDVTITVDTTVPNAPVYTVTPTVPLADGTYTVSVETDVAEGAVTDATGNPVAPASIDFLVDATAPSVANVALVSQPAANSTVPVIVQVTIADAASLVSLASLTVDDFTVTLDGVAVTPTSLTPDVVADSATVVATLEVPAPAGGWTETPVDLQVTFSGAVEDTLGNVSTETPVTDIVVTPSTALAAATLEVNAGGDLFTSTFGNNSFVITNTGEVDLVGITINSSTGYLPDVVFDPAATAGDSGAKFVTAGNAGDTAATVGLTQPLVLGTNSGDFSPFSQPHNGVDGDDGWDALTLLFDDFNAGESFAFGVDMDPTSIKGDLSTGDAGSISGFELIGSTVEFVFADGTVITTNLFDEGSLGGSAASVASDQVPADAPVIELLGFDANPTTVPDLDQIVRITGTVGATVTLLQVDARLFIDPGNPTVGYDVDPFEANEAIAKVIQTVTIGAEGFVDVAVTLLETPGAGAAPDGGINHFIAAYGDGSAQAPYGRTSETLVAEFAEPPAALVEVTPNGDLGASTFGAGSFLVTNESGAAITSIEIDLRGLGTVPGDTLVTDAVLDPTGTAGDDLASALQISSDGGTGAVIPGSGPTAGTSELRPDAIGTANELLTLDFTNFDVGETVTFTIDVDPNSIATDPNSGGSGAVSGAELAGALVRITRSDGTVQLGQLFHDGSAGGAAAVVVAETLASPLVVTLEGADVLNEAEGLARSDGATPTLRVTGTEGATFKVVQTDLGFQSDAAAPDPATFNYGVPFEFYGNEVTGLVNLNGGAVFTIGAEGFVDVALTLTADLSNLAVALVDPETGENTGPVSHLRVLQGDLPNTPPEAVDDSFTVDEGEALSGNVLVANGDAADSDADPEDVLTTSLVSGPASGQVVLQSNGDFIYVPNDGFTGTDSFVYELSDGTETDQATVTITVEADGPVDLVLVGENGVADTLIGGDGNDLLRGLTGLDFHDGGAGVDTVDISHSGADADVDLTLGEIDWFNFGKETALNIENVIATDGDNVIIGTSGDNVIDGRGGFDTVVFTGKSEDYVIGTPDGSGTFTVTGPDGTDTLTSIEQLVFLGDASDEDLLLVGTNGADLLQGGSGNDVVRGLRGLDTQDGGAGEDVIDVSHTGVAANIDLAAGTVDFLRFGVEQASNFEHVIGTDGDNEIVGTAGNNVVDGEGGFDTFVASGVESAYSVLRIGELTALIGPDGNDVLVDVEAVAFADGTVAVGDLAETVIVGSNGGETLNGTGADERVQGLRGLDSHDGGAGIDVLDLSHTGAPADIDLAAGFADFFAFGIETATNFEFVVGTGGANTISGTNGDNVVDGGGDFDTFVINGIRDDYSVLEVGEAVVVIGAEGHDVLTNVEELSFADTDVLI